MVHGAELRHDQHECGDNGYAERGVVREFLQYFAWIGSG